MSHLKCNTNSKDTQSTSLHRFVAAEKNKARDGKGRGVDLIN